MNTPFLVEHLPAPLLAPGPGGLLLWQWLALPVLLVVALALGSALGWVTRRFLGHLAARTRTTWDDVLLERIAPLTALWAIAIVVGLQPMLALPDGAERVLQRCLRVATYLVVFWAGFRSVGVAFAVAAQAPWTRASPSLAGLLPFARRLTKGIIIVLGGVAALNELGFQVASLLAGLGIGGIALALAAQKTVENLFGSFSIGVDQPFREGDFVKIEDFTGTVERIGMRSTRFRTLDRTVITMPNGRLSETRTETFAARDRIRLLANLALVYGTTAAQLREVIAGIEQALRAHPKIFKEGIGVRFTALGESALNVEVTAWFETADWDEFCAIRTEVLLGFMEIVERAGTSFAFPTRTVYLVRAGAQKERGPDVSAGPSRDGGAERDRTVDL
jgi:MscS family membrane protein